LAKTNGSIKRRSFGKIKEVVEMPNLLSVQIDSFEDFLQLDVAPRQRQRRGLHLVFESIFPLQMPTESTPSSMLVTLLEIPVIAKRNAANGE